LALVWTLYFLVQPAGVNKKLSRSVYLEERVDVLAMSDINDAKTFATALAAAERSLVLCRVTAPSSVEAILKLIDLAAPEERAKIRARLAVTLIGTIGLTALPRAGGQGFVHAAEVLRIDNAARELIRDGIRIHSLPEYLRSHATGSQTFEEAIRKLHRDHLISDEWVAQRAACFK
jgi:twitching motility protein PilT